MRSSVCMKSRGNCCTCVTMNRAIFEKRERSLDGAWRIWDGRIWIRGRAEMKNNDVVPVAYA